MAVPFKYGANYGGENYNALSQGLATGQQIANSRQSNAINQLKMDEYQQDRPAQRKLTEAKTQDELMKIRTRAVQSMLGPVTKLREIYADALKQNNNDPNVALEAVQPLYEQHVRPVLEEAGINPPKTYDDRAAQMFTAQKPAESNALMTTPQYFDDSATGGKPGVYFPTKEGKPGTFVRKPLAGDLKEGKGDKESESDKEYNRLVSTYSEDYPDIPKKDLESIISRAKKNMGGFASEKTLDSEMQLLVDKYNEKRRDKLSLPSSKMMTGSDEWPPKFKAKGGQSAPASKRYGNKLTILD